jgi:hypothetical protein
LCKDVLYSNLSKINNMPNLKFNKEELNAIVGVIEFFEKVCANAATTPADLAPQKEYLFKQLYNVLDKIDKAI